MKEQNKHEHIKISKSTIDSSSSQPYIIENNKTITVDCEEKSDNGCIHLHGNNSSIIENANHVTYNIFGSTSNNQKASTSPLSSSFINKKRITVLFLLFILICSLCIIVRIIQKYNTFNNLMSIAESEMKSGDMLEAAKTFSQAAAAAPNRNTYVKAVCLEADSFLILGMFSSPKSNNPQGSYYDTAITLYYKIIKNPKYTNTDYYIDCASGLNDCYLYSNYSTDDIRWINTIEILENYAENVNEKNNATQTIKIYLSLCLYYEHLVSQSAEDLMNAEYETKALMYSYKLCDLFSRFEYSIGIDSASYDIYFLAQTIDRSLMYSVVVYGTDEYIRHAINTCQHIIDEINSSQYLISPESFHYIYYVLGKACVLEGILNKSDTGKEYMNRAYKILSPFLSDNSIINASNLTNTAYYCLLTGDCSEDDLQYIEKILQETEEGIFLNKPDTKTLHQAIEILSMYTIIDGKYDYKRNISQNGIELVNKLKFYSFQMTESDQKELETIEKYFQGEININELPVNKFF